MPAVAATQMPTVHSDIVKEPTNNDFNVEGSPVIEATEVVLIAPKEGNPDVPKDDTVKKPETNDEVVEAGKHDEQLQDYYDVYVKGSQVIPATEVLISPTESGNPGPNNDTVKEPQTNNSMWKVPKSFQQLKRVVATVMHPKRHCQRTQTNDQAVEAGKHGEQLQDGSDSEYSNYSKKSLSLKKQTRCAKKKPKAKASGKKSKNSSYYSILTISIYSKHSQSSSIQSQKKKHGNSL